MAMIIVKVTRDQHRQIKRDAKEKGKTISDYVRNRLKIDRGTMRGESDGATSATKREA